MTSQETLLGVEELAARWGVTPRVIYGRRFARDCPPAVKVGRVLRFRLADVEAWEAEKADHDAGRAS